MNRPFITDKGYALKIKKHTDYMNWRFGLNTIFFKKTIQISLVISCILMLVGCASAPTSQVRTAAESTYKGEPVPQFLSHMAKHGLFCQELAQYEHDPRLKKFTDGTFKDVGFYQCLAAKDGGLCVHSEATYMLSQYGKVIRVAGLQKAKNCLWN